MRTYGDVGLVPVFLHTTTDFVKSHRPELVKFLAGHLDKADMISKNPKQAAQLAVKAASAKGYDISEDAFMRVFKRIDFKIEVDKEAIQAFNDAGSFLLQEKKIKQIPKLVHDDTLLADAKKLRQKTK
jgi:ABC-type nitrate/sulfonate/bicarbonate transport system substrate-binding protein